MIDVLYESPKVGTPRKPPRQRHGRHRAPTPMTRWRRQLRVWLADCRARRWRRILCGALVLAAVLTMCVAAGVWDRLWGPGPDTMTPPDPAPAPRSAPRLVLSAEHPSPSGRWTGEAAAKLVTASATIRPVAYTQPAKRPAKRPATRTTTRATAAHHTRTRAVHRHHTRHHYRQHRHAQPTPAAPKTVAKPAPKTVAKPTPTPTPHPRPAAATAVHPGPTLARKPSPTPRPAVKPLVVPKLIPRAVPLPPPAPLISVRCGAAALAGTQPQVSSAGRDLMARFGIAESNVLGRAARGTAGSDHPAGLALDFMVRTNRPLGDALAAYVLAHRAELHVSYVIWQQRINLGGGWSPMADRGSPTANHLDHVHVSFTAGGC